MYGISYIIDDMVPLMVVVVLVVLLVHFLQNKGTANLWKQYMLLATPALGLLVVLFALVLGDDMIDSHYQQQRNITYNEKRDRFDEQTCANRFDIPFNEETYEITGEFTPEQKSACIAQEIEEEQKMQSIDTKRTMRKGVYRILALFAVFAGHLFFYRKSKKA